MGIALACAKCGARMEYQDADAGRSAECPTCRGEIQVPLHLKMCVGCRRQVAAELTSCPACGTALGPGAEAGPTTSAWGCSESRRAGDRVFEPSATGAGQGHLVARRLDPRHPAMMEPPPVGPASEPGSSGKAIGSLVLGLVSFVCLLACFTGVPAIVLGVLAHEEIRRAAGRLRGQGMATVGIVCGAIGLVLIPIMLALFLPAMNLARVVSQRNQCSNNLSQISLALHSYHNAWGSFPPAYSTDPAGRPLLSWRVLILPYMSEAELYGEFRLDEPWDSSHNLGVAAMMPQAFRCPSDPFSFSNQTSYLAIAGPGTIFPPDRAVSITDITDGVAETAMIGEVKSSTIGWTQPEDFVPDTILIGPGKLSSFHPDGWHMLMGDGTVRFISDTIDRIVLRALTTMQGGEPIGPDSF